MSEKIEKLLEEQKNVFTKMTKRLDDLEAKGQDGKKELDTGVEQMNDALTKMDDALASIDKIEKQAKARKEIESALDSSAQGRKETSEFLKSLQLMRGMNAKSQGFDTRDFVSVKELKNHVSGNTADGAMFAMPFLDSQIGMLMREFSPIRSIASVVNISGDSYRKIVKKKNAGAYRKSAMSDFTSETKKDTFGDLIINVDDLFAIALYDDNLLSDAQFNLVADLLASISEDFAITEAEEFVNGDGNEGLRGILTYTHSTTDAFGTIEQHTSATSATVDFDDMIDCQALLKNVYTQNASWMMNRNSKAVIRKIKDTTGQYIWQPAVSAGAPSTVLGSPLIELFEAPNITNSSLSIVYGDVRSAYQIVDRSGMEVTRDNLTQYPDIAYKVKKRSGGGLKKGEALKILKAKA